MERQLILHGTNENLIYNTKKGYFETWKEGHMSGEIFTNNKETAINIFKFTNQETWTPTVEGC